MQTTDVEIDRRTALELFQKEFDRMAQHSARGVRHD